MAGTSSTGPGAVRVQPGWVELNADRSADERAEITMENTADRPVQIGSHVHLPDVNAALQFDREVAYGHRLDIAAGTSLRFEPGASRRVAIIALRGRRVVPGLQIDNAQAHRASNAAPSASA